MQRCLGLVLSGGVTCIMSSYLKIYVFLSIGTFRRWSGLDLKKYIFMEFINSSWFQPPTLLTGIPGLETVQIWISIPLCIMYINAILGNCTILFVIKTISSLHEPQYIFLSMLADTDVGLSLSTLPTVFNVFLLNNRGIEFHSCLTQMFFIHTFSCMESAILLARPLINL